MSGELIFTIVGRDAIAEHVLGHCFKFRLGEGGFEKSNLVTEIIDAGATGSQKAYTYTISGGDFDIIAVDPIAEEVEVLGDQTAFFEAGAQVKIVGSTGNDGTYTVASSSFGGVNTVIVLNEDITDPTNDGKIYVTKLPICKGPVTDQFHHPSAVVEYNGVTPVQKLEDTTGTGGLTQTLGGATGSGTVNYKTGDLDIEFENYPAPGNTVKVEYKYANVPKAPTAGREALYSQGDTEGPGGVSSLYTYEREFVSSELEVRGVGYATLRCTMHLAESQGIDDGDAWGGTPYYFEGGIFDEDDVLLVYFTYDKERKTGGTTLTHTVDAKV